MVFFGDRVSVGIWGNWGGDLVGGIGGDVVGEKFVDFRALNLVIEGFFRKFVCFMTQASKRALRTL